MVAIRMMRTGKKHRPFFRIVVQKSRGKNDGIYIESLGTFDPLAKKDEIRLKLDRFRMWRSRGAQASETVRTLFKKAEKAEKASTAS
jgi:small subunit ribosomal protein S16